MQDNQRLLRSPDGSPGEVIGSWFDITVRKQAEEAQASAETKLENQRARSMHSDRLRSLGEMAAGMAHELNQPLVGVRGMAEHTLIGVDRNWNLSPEDLKTRLQNIIQQADRMVHIIQHVRLLAREADKPNLENLSVNDVVESSMDLIGAQFRSHGITLQTDLANGLPHVLANPFSLEQVLLNLLSNARDAIEERRNREDKFEPKMVLRTLAAKGDSSLVHIEIEDNGGGIPEEIQTKIFDPFFTTKDPDKGTGLGLSISKSILGELGGDLVLKNNDPKKTTLIISLPIAC